MIRQVVVCPPRNDPAGLGHFGAPRGSRKHRGRDYECRIDAEILSPVDGVVVSDGQAYRSTKTYKILNIRGDDGNLHRLFYVARTVVLGTRVDVDSIVGVAQNVTQMHTDEPGMQPHVHYEVKDAQGKYRDPENLETTL